MEVSDYWTCPAKLRAKRSADGRTYTVHASEMIPVRERYVSLESDGEYSIVTFDDDLEARRFYFRLVDSLCT